MVFRLLGHNNDHFIDIYKCDHKCVVKVTKDNLRVCEKLLFIYNQNNNSTSTDLILCGSILHPYD